MEQEKLGAIQNKVFKEFDICCRTNGFRYYLLGETMLGAIRHKGFIPWDDDIDVGMPRCDYKRF
jgi:lipopolysaccharide cholinephosphotransferase